MPRHVGVVACSGWVAARGPVVAFGMGPLAAAPPAHADILDVIVDPIIQQLTDASPPGESYSSSSAASTSSETSTLV
jgi:hypothetical protein